MARTLVVIGIVACAASLAAQGPRPAFEVASVKKQASKIPPSGPPAPAPPTTTAFYRGNATVVSLIQFAYAVPRTEIVGGPDWAREDLFEINARSATPEPPDRMRLMLRSLLEDRFKLVVGREPREMQSYVLTMVREDGRPGARLERCEDPANLPPVKPIRILRGGYPVPLSGRCAAISSIATSVSGILRAPVVDKTGLTGLWHYGFVFADPDNAPPPNLPDSELAPSLATGLREELGIRLESIRGPVDVLVIRSVEQPSEN